MSRLVITLLLTFLIACTNQVKQNSIILNYSDFGPQIIASEIIGMEWWQWQSHGESRPTTTDIKVVVYKDILLKEVETIYPLNPKKRKDYRYLEYKKALDFLGKKIDENILEQVTNNLKLTRSKLINKFKK